jgi:hypothetical protein
MAHLYISLHSKWHKDIRDKHTFAFLIIKIISYDFTNFFHLYRHAIVLLKRMTRKETGMRTQLYAL